MKKVLTVILILLLVVGGYFLLNQNKPSLNFKGEGVLTFPTLDGVVDTELNEAEVTQLITYFNEGIGAKKIGFNQFNGQIITLISQSDYLSVEVSQDSIRFTEDESDLSSKVIYRFNPEQYDLVIEFLNNQK